MMQKVFFTLVFASVFVSASSLEQKQELIAKKKAAIKKLQESVKELESSLLAEKIAAEHITMQKQSELKTHTEFGYSKTSGNTQTDTISLELDIKKAINKHTYSLHLDGQYATDNNIESKNKYLLALNYNYKVTNRFSFDYLVGVKQDRFSSFDYQFYTGPGGKYMLINNLKHRLSLDGNLLYSQDKFSDINRDASGNVIAYPNPNNLAVASTTKGATDTYESIRLKADYKWRILDNLEFIQEMSYRNDISNEDNYFVYAKTGLVNKINSIFSFGVNYKVDYVNQPTDGKKDIDTTLTANIIMDY